MTIPHQPKQVKSMWYYVFWSVATISVVLGQVYVASSYRELASALSKLLWSITWILNKAEKKLLKFQTKAQECVSREKAQKIIKKSDKWSLKNNIILWSLYLIENRSQYPHRGVENPAIAARIARFLCT